MTPRARLYAFWDGLQAWDGPELPAGVYCAQYARWWRLGRVLGVLGAAGLCLATVLIVWWLAVMVG